MAHKKLKHYRMDMEGKAIHIAMSILGLSFFLRTVYYFACVRIETVGAWELLSWLILPMLLEAAFIENPEPTSPYGTKSLGEPPACSPAPAIRNAIANATGVAIDCCPITPHVLYREFKKAGLIED